MKTSRKLLLAGVAAMAATAMASSALAQNTSTASVTAAATVISPINISATGSLNFGRVVLDGSANDASLVLHTGDTSLSSPTNATAVAGTAVSTPVFTVKGQAGQAYDMTVTPSLVIGGSNRLSVTGGFGTGATNLTVAGVTVPFVYTLAVPAGTAAATYNGTVTVSVTYE
ncbi:DUF4402 domain-containing protein [Phenylobacterium sp.]|uniref:DUF4402 domain-containing protein n=1 Tax=Phenylobacterium sp. TaxID=1871053 RepID=UPI002DF268EB|nr:DUF4402 domain-containing protein [Phenylobacterium sp.]